MAEVEFHVRQAFQLVQKGLVEGCAVDGADEAAVDVVLLRLFGQVAVAVLAVDHAAIHGDRLG